MNPTNFRSYAVAGANTGDSNSGFNLGGIINLPGMKQEVDNYLSDSKGTADPNALYFLWGGANDYFTGDPAAAAAHNLAGYVSTLAESADKHFLVPNLPDLSLRLINSINLKRRLFRLPLIPRWRPNWEIYIFRGPVLPASMSILFSMGWSRIRQSSVLQMSIALVCPPEIFLLAAILRATFSGTTFIPRAGRMVLLQGLLPAQCRSPKRFPCSWRA